MTRMLIVVGVVVATLGFVKYRQVRTGMAQGAAFQPPPEAVTTIVTHDELWDETLAAIGTVTAVHGVTVAADLPGIVEKIEFDSGRRVTAGDVLIKLDTRQEQAQLKAAEAQRDLARLHLDRIRGLRQKGISSQAELDSAEAELTQAEARVGEISATIDRKTIRAPFAGILGIRQVNLGQYLAGGDPVVPLQSLQPIYVDFSVPQQQVGRIHPGGEVRVTVEGRSGTPQAAPRVGRVSAIDSVVDAATRNVQVQATLDNADGELKPGMFVEARVLLGQGDRIIAVPTSAISYAPYGDSVFVVEELQGPDGTSYKGVRQQFVKLGEARGDQVAILSGVDAGAEVVTSGVFKLRNGAAVLVNNEVQPGNDPAPRPADS